MAIKTFRAGRQNYDPTTYVGVKGELYYVEDTGLMRLCDGVTPGGKIVGNLAIAATGTTAPINPYPGELWYNPTTKELWAYYNGQFRGTINPATPTTLGGIKAGPGVVVASDGTLSLDSTGIPFNFGDFYAFTHSGPSDGACLSSINLNQDVNIVSNGTGAINIVGTFEIHKTNADLETALTTTPVFAVSADGDITASSLDIQETADLGLMAALNVTINEAGLTKTPTVVTGSVAQFTGRDARASVILLDSYGIDIDRSITGGEFTFRTGRGTNASTTAVQSGDRLGLVTAAGWASNGYGGVGVAGLRILANENFTATARGSKLELFVTANGTITPATVATVDSTGITMASGKVFTGNLTGTADVATTVALVATNTTDAAHYLTFVDSATGNENVRTDTSLTYNPSTNTLSTGTISATTGTFTGFTGKHTRNSRDAGTLGAAGTLTVDFATDDHVLVNLTTTATIAFSNIAVGKTVTVLVKNATGQNRAVTLGVAAGNTSNGNASPNVNDGRTGVLVYRSFGTTAADVYCEFN